MQLDWQTIAVLIIVAGAVLYVARRALARLRSFTASKSGGSCETGCGKCGEVDAPLRQSSVLVQVGKVEGKRPPRR